MGGYIFEVMDEFDGGDWQEFYVIVSFVDYDNDSYLDFYFMIVYLGNYF